jgi:hypothetical protein
MNIFAIDPDPIICAEELDNKRVVKMVLETCQLLSTAINVTGGIGPYRTTHVNHPCSIWVRETRANYDWTVEHFQALLSEYTHRYGKTHKCHQYLELFKARRIMFKDEPLTTHPNCTTFKDVADVHKAYRLYMAQKWDNDKLKPSWAVKVS